MALASGPMQAPGSLCYLKYDQKFEHEKPYFIRFPVDDYPGAKQTNLEFDFYDVKIEDIRGQEEDFQFDVHGFEIIKFRSRYQYGDFDDFQKIAPLYNQEIEQFMKNKMGFEFVEVYDILIRRRTAEFPRSQFQAEHIQPIRAVHVDSSRKERVKQAMKSLEKAGIDPTKGRTQMFGLWRPLKGPVKDWPLAVCDYRTCDAKDIVDVDQVYPDAVGEGCNIYFNENHRWYFVSNQMPDEALLIKQMDSDTGAADYCAHAAFPWKDVEANNGMRESVEVRCVAWSPEGK